MCGRVRPYSDVSEISIAFSIPPHRPTLNFAPTWNGAPTDNFPIVRRDKETGERSVDLMRWRLVPYWAKDIKIGFSTINTMAETVGTKPVFREAFQRRRCIVPVDNFYEWRSSAHRRSSPTTLARSVGDGPGRALGDLEVASQQRDPVT